MNIYSLPAGSVRAHSIYQRMKFLNLLDTYPTIIARDFTLHQTEETTTEPIAAAKAMADWLQDKSFRYSMNITTQRFTIIIAYTTRHAT